MLEIQDLITALEKMEVGEGFNIKFLNDSLELTIGVRCIDIMDTVCILFGGYSMEILTYNLNENEDYDLIVNQVMNTFGIEEILEFINNNN